MEKMRFDPGDGLFAGRLFCGALAIAVALVAPAAMAAEDRAPAIDSELVDAMFDDAYARYSLPGLAVGIVIDGELAYARTAGELAAGGGEAIDASTVFKIASNSKAMTTALLARLVDQGKLKWDDPVVKHLPDFRMYHDWVTREMQVRDLLLHNSGLGGGAGDIMLWPEPNLFTREDVIRGLGHIKPIYSFRTRYAYNNSPYIVAGEVAAAAGGAPYDVLVRREVFAPLGLKRCQVGEWRRDEVGNVAQAHRRSGDSNVVIRADDEVIPDVPMMAAGGIRCSLDDMATWMKAWLQPEGDITGVDGERWLSAAQREELWKSHMPMQLSRQMREWDRSHFSDYGYGWRLTDVDGTSKVSHTGTLSGMYSTVVLLPEKNVGIVFMSNGAAAEARTVLPQVLVKHFTDPDGRATNTVAHYAQWLEQSRSEKVRGEKTEVAAPAREPVASAELADRLGRYRDPWFGEIELCPVGEGVRLRSLKSPRLHGEVMRQDGRTMLAWRDAGVDAWLDIAGDGRLRLSRMDPESNTSSDYENLEFSRIGECP